MRPNNILLCRGLASLLDREEALAYEHKLRNSVDYVRANLHTINLNIEDWLRGGSKKKNSRSLDSRAQKGAQELIEAVCAFVLSLFPFLYVFEMPCHCSENLLSGMFHLMRF